MRKAIFLGIALLLSACSDGKEASLNTNFSGNDAIAKVLDRERDVRFSSDVSFPAEAKKVKGIIHGGGPAPGITIPGEFESSAKEVRGDTFIVTLTEYWDANDFKNSEEKEGILSAYWKYEVTPTSVKFIEQGGDSSPELIE
ncbi:hypothetical protein [Paenibacillus sp. GCM10027626]|uniref:hypothetical protein n=1 Tax=Paenibacillus sp. GCM10027626 TaxID=3273411 RepID=UPI00362A558B